MKREIRNVSKDASLFLILLLAPILYAFMYGSIYLNKGEEKVKLALVDDDATTISRTLTSELNSTSIIDIIPASA
ncbi:MAG: ABC transporter permease [Weeksellaceae bacterium]|nr:ABC transporter permease [Weeksellaceae bacterium]